MRSQLRLLGQNGHIQIGQFPVLEGGHGQRTGDQHFTRSVFEFRIRIREKVTDVAEAKCAQQRVNDRVDRSIRIAVSQKSAQAAGDLASAEIEGPVRCKSVEVRSVPDPILVHTYKPFLFVPVIRFFGKKTVDARENWLLVYCFMA